jgi:hypothetical protein
MNDIEIKTVAPTVIIEGKEFRLGDLECEDCGFITGERKEDVAHALEEHWGANTTQPCYVEVCDC